MSSSAVAAAAAAAPAAVAAAAPIIAAFSAAIRAKSTDNCSQLITPVAPYCEFSNNVIPSNKTFSQSLSCCPPPSSCRLSAPQPPLLPLASASPLLLQLPQLAPPPLLPPRPASQLLLQRRLAHQQRLHRSSECHRDQQQQGEAEAAAVPAQVGQQAG